MKRRSFVGLLGGLAYGMTLESRGMGTTAIAAAQTSTGSATHHHSAMKVMILDGQSAGAYHNWKLTTPVIKKLLEDAGLFDVTVVTAPKADEDFSSFSPDMSAYKAIVMNYDAPDWPAEMRARFEKYVSDGGGLVIVHASNNSFPNWAAYNEMTGIGGWRSRNENAGPYWYFQDGKLVSDPAPGPAGMHGNRLPYQVMTHTGEHPIMRGLPPVWMHAADELYGKLRGPGKNMTVLATAHSDPQNKGTGNEEPMLVVLHYGKGRIFHTVMGHDVYALSCVGFTTTLQRGAEWAATGLVTQKIPANFPTPTSVSYRVDIAEMDPDMLKGASDPIRK